MIDIEYFSSVIMIVGSIVSAERIEGSDKMLKLQIDIGELEPRTVLSGIARYYLSDDLVGRRCVVVANLRPRKMMGVESNGMLLCTSYKGGDDEECVRIIELATDVPVGSRLS